MMTGFFIDIFFVEVVASGVMMDSLILNKRTLSKSQKFSHQ
jgi:hypothetical protein